MILPLSLLLHAAAAGAARGRANPGRTRRTGWHQCGYYQPPGTRPDSRPASGYPGPAGRGLAVIRDQRLPGRRSRGGLRLPSDEAALRWTAPASHPLWPDLPTGTVTFLFTDIEGSTRLLQRLGPAYAQALGEHQALLRAAFAAHGGVEVDTQGDAFFVAFATAPEAVAAAAEATRALAAHAWPEGATLRVRMGLHTGTPAAGGRPLCRAWTSTAPRASPRLGMAGRCCSPRRRAPWSSTTCPRG